MSTPRRPLDRLADLVSTVPETGAPPAETALELLALAERLLASGEPDPAASPVWHRYLDATGRRSFMQALPGDGHRARWAETAFAAILVSGYTLETLLAGRVRRAPDAVLFREAGGGVPTGLSYGEAARRLRVLAGLFCSLEAEPRVAIYAENSLEGACCDLACLVHRIFVAPLSVHLDARSLAWVFDRLSIDTVVTDSAERLARLDEARPLARRPFRTLVTRAREVDPSRGPAATEPLDEACARLDLERADALLARRRPRPLTDVATVMFTSGSTGAHKGVAFTLYNLLAKRFARAAALPDVGDREVLLCYLPLFHTFGRFLELLGSVYWGGTYVFAGNPSFETLAAELPRVRPTGLIGVPLRWSQLRDHARERMSEASGNAREAAFREVVGDRLHWGLSAAGHLDPGVFRFFQKLGVDLCSGFGMTEATGGVTMTPPGAYVDGTVGVPLPGIRTRFGPQGELEIAGPYVARYLDEDAGAGLPPQDPCEPTWLATGDLFRARADGYLEIVDRIKDIYKNSRGQTVSPRRVEQRFDGVPGIRRAFLAGDGRESNVLLIVPERDDGALPTSEGEARDYFRQIVAAANAHLAPYERIVDFAVLERDFDAGRGELTPKGTYRRKAIEAGFAEVIERLYLSNAVELRCGARRVRVPRWLFRELGLLEGEIVAGRDELICARTGRRLVVRATGDAGAVRLGDLEYGLRGEVVDLGVFARQPRLWVGNAALAAFCPCKDGWDVPTPAAQVRLPWRSSGDGADPGVDAVGCAADERLWRLHRLCVDALARSGSAALEAVERLGRELPGCDGALAGVIRRRLEALARHPDEEVRCRAYRILLRDEPRPDTNEALSAFVESGLTFLNEASVRAIADAGFGDRRLEALRQRLARYRARLDWPASPLRRRQFERVFDLLCEFAHQDLGEFGTVRAELASWALHSADPELAAAAEVRLSALVDQFHAAVTDHSATGGRGGTLELGGVGAADAERLERVLRDPGFVKQSLLLVYDEGGFELGQVRPSGFRVSRGKGGDGSGSYRVAIDLRSGRHFELEVVLGDLARPRRRETLTWLTALADRPSRSAVLPRLGACRPDLGAISFAWVRDPTVEARIGALLASEAATAGASRRHLWRQLFVRGMAATFALWRRSGGRVVAAATPANVAVPEADFREGACVLSLDGWRPYERPASLVLPLLAGFFRQPAALESRVAPLLEVGWIFDACLEALGAEGGRRFLTQLDADLSGAPRSSERDELAAALAAYRAGAAAEPFLPLGLACACERYAQWTRANQSATPAARLEEVEQLGWLYRIERFGAALRYRLYRATYFEGANAAAHAAFDRLLERLARTPDRPGVHLEELSDLQAALADPADREAFARMVFSRARAEQRLEVLRLAGSEGTHVIVRSEIVDTRGAHFRVREPVGPAEVGTLYRLLRDAAYPRPISDDDSHLVVTDESDQVIGGLAFVAQERDSVVIKGPVVAAPLQGRGIAEALLEDFCVRMAARGVRLVKTDFVLQPTYGADGFTVDARFGGLVRPLG